MRGKERGGPPWLARRLVRLAVPRREQEWVLGDLEERFRALRGESGTGRARRWYWRQCATAWWPGTLLGWGRSGPVRHGAWRHWSGLGGAWTGWRQTVRRLHRHGTTSAAVIILLAVGVGGVTAVEAIFRVLLHPTVGVPDAQSVAWVTVDSAGVARWLLAPAELARLEDGLAVPVGGVLPAGAAVRVGDVAGSGSVAYVSAGYFTALGGGFALGRPLSATAVADREVVVSHRFWETRLGAAGAVLGMPILVDRQAYTVVGVTARDFTGIARPDLWLPLGARATVPGVRAFVRLPALAAAVRVTVAARTLLAGEKSPALRIRLRPVTEPASAGERRAVGWAAALLSALAGLVLLGACAAAGNLLVAESIGRRLEFATRLAVGARRRRLGAMLLGENLLLAGLAMPVAAVWVIILLRLIPAWLPLGVSAAQPFELDGRMMGLAAVLAIAAALVASLPALRVVGTADVLRTRTSGGALRSRTMDVLLGVQFAQAFVLLAWAGLLGTSLQALGRLPLGFEPAGTRVATLSLPSAFYDSTAAYKFHTRLLAALSAEPGIAGVGFSRSVPVIGTAAGTVHRADAVEGPPLHPLLVSTSAGWFPALGIRLLQGRIWRDDEHDVAVVSADFAREAWPGTAALGRQIVFADGARARIVGITAGGTFGTTTMQPVVYRPMDLRHAGALTVVLRGAAGVPPPTSILRAAVGSLDADVPVRSLGGMRDLLDRSHLLQRGMSHLAFLLGALALAISAFGLYAHVDRHARDRTREIAIRVALGAAPGQAARRIGHRAGRIGVIGGTLGLALAAVTGSLGAHWFFGLAPFEPGILGGAAVLLTLCSLLAIVIPTHRATRNAPLASLARD